MPPLAFRIVLWFAVFTLGTGCLPGEPESRCVDANTLETCRGDDCASAACRVDETCADDRCVPWFEGPLGVDFELTIDETDPQRIHVRLAEGGFPRPFAEEIRFTFGDGVAGWGERLSHLYADPGVYPVELSVRLDGLRTLRASRTAVVGVLPDDAATVTLTVNGIPDYLNGTKPYRSNNGTPDPSDDHSRPFHLLLPTHGFTVDVTLAAPSQRGIEVSSLELVSDRPLGDGAVPTGANLANRLQFPSNPVDRLPLASWTVTPADAFAPGMHTLLLRARDALGTVFERSLVFETIELTPELEPLEEPYGWLFRFDMDAFTVTGGLDSKSIPQLDATAGPDGLPDFEQELRILGLQGDEAGPGAKTLVARGVTGANAIYRTWVEDEVVRHVRLMFGIRPDGTPTDDIPLEIQVAGRPGAPDPATFSPDGAFSMMRFGGSLGAFFGRSWVSDYARSKVDDTDPGLGVGTVRITGALFGNGLVTEAFEGLRPGTGAAVGDHPLDALVLADTFDRWQPTNDEEANARFDLLAYTARLVGISVAVVTAHEMGHAMGLMPDGTPPTGLFGNGVDVPFIGPATNERHADFPGFNLMQSGTAIWNLAFELIRFVDLPAGVQPLQLAELALREQRLSSYERSYLRGVLTVHPR